MIQLLSVEAAESPLLPRSVRLSARIEDGELGERTLWFDIPEELSRSGLERGEAWLSLLLATAAVQGEDLRIDLPIDPMLLDRARDIQSVWRSWYDWVKPFQIEAPAALSPPAGKQTASYFSGGVDSFFTLLRSVPQRPGPHYPAIDCLVTIWGFDVPLSKPEEFSRLRALVERTAEKFGKAPLFVATNLKTMPVFKAHWGNLSHGSALAGIGHLLADRFREVLIASSHDYSRGRNWGSHILTDPLFSSQRTRIVYDGAGASRMEKTRRVISNPEAARTVRVCWQGRRATNCSECSGCLMTMAAIDVLGLQDLAVSFDWSKYSLAKLEKVHQDRAGRLPREVRDVARERGREDVAWAFDRNFERSSAWEERREKLDKLFEQLLPEPRRALLIDDETLRPRCRAATRLIPFPEKDGVRQGRPAHDRDAVAELERQRANGVRYVAIAWPSFWWRDHYRGLAERLETEAVCEHEDNILAFYRLNDN